MRSRVYETARRPSVRLFVRPSNHSTEARRCGRFAAVGPAGMQDILINSGGVGAGLPPAASPQQHGVRQRMRAVPRRQPTCEAEHMLVGY